MQLTKIGLGRRMGADMVWRLMDSRIECVMHERNTEHVVAVPWASSR